ncbi:hypothetical protein D7Y09_18200, partial [bacterium 1XD42-1]
MCRLRKRHVPAEVSDGQAETGLLHIVFNSTAIDCTRKFRNFWRSSFAIRKISDMLCLENGLSVIAEPKPSRGSYGTWLGESKPPTIRG